MLRYPLEIGSLTPSTARSGLLRGLNSHSLPPPGDAGINPTSPAFRMPCTRCANWKTGTPDGALRLGCVLTIGKPYLAGRIATQFRAVHWPGYTRTGLDAGDPRYQGPPTIRRPGLLAMRFCNVVSEILMWWKPGHHNSRHSYSGVLILVLLPHIMQRSPPERIKKLPLLGNEWTRRPSPMVQESPKGTSP